MIDENAFGLIVSYLSVEDDEYSLEPADFAARCRAFGDQVRGYLVEAPVGSDVHAIDFGHAFYLELAEGDQKAPLIAWLKRLRQSLRETLEIDAACILTHGSRWVSEQQVLPREERASDLTLTKLAHSSEALRRALYAETACHSGDTTPGWGAGVYVDTEAVEALDLTLKNVPTPLEVASATFYRAGA